MDEFPQLFPKTPIIGICWRLSTKKDVFMKQALEMLDGITETAALWGGPYPLLYISTADDAEIILSNVKYIDKGDMYHLLLSNWLKTGLLTSTGAKWHQRRKILTPAFHLNILQGFIEVFNEQCDSLTRILHEESRMDKTNLWNVMSKTTLATICETSMGIKPGQVDDSFSNYFHAMHTIGDVIFDKALNPLLFNDMICSISPVGRRERKLIKTLHKFTSNVIKTREQNFDIKEVESIQNGNSKQKKYMAMLDLLLYIKNHSGEIDDAGIQEEVDTFVFEGHDTTAIALNFVIMLIANHKNVQEKIVTELKQIFGNSKRHATYQDLQDMKYLECCLKESLRLYPSVAFIARKSFEEIKLTHHTCPVGTELIISIYKLHRDPKYFPDPEKFDPDRFSPENSKGRNPYAYIPFSAGPRNCIGQKFAMLELKSVVSSILRNFKIEPVDKPEDLTLLMDLVLRTKEPIHVKFVPRIEKVY